MKISLFAILLIPLLLLTSCSNNNEINSKEYLGEIYSIALDSIMEKDEALSSDMEFIAIDMSNFDELNEQELNEPNKVQILSYFEGKYKVEAMDASYENLIEKGLYNPDTMVLNGVLLRIEKVDFVSNDFMFEGSKYRAGDGSVTVKGIVQYHNGKWVIKDTKVTQKS
ncbi:hypothetical protein FHS15_001793 [Paenibacillus castaneae]|uniref:peptide ABC transporter substrate-binding protein n=1 Tax=Paenibacillus castaneae TaxID=474957 RepID=UPI000C9B0658|nr:peptide ABC transporter substrate-binding protein [Paenibacillus castaneae]NIK76668.1 hypothetical protein [Paenibacillus castaneae]